MIRANNVSPTNVRKRRAHVADATSARYRRPVVFPQSSIKTIITVITPIQNQPW
jgi:hypothetical protein